MKIFSVLFFVLNAGAVEPDFNLRTMNGVEAEQKMNECFGQKSECTLRIEGNKENMALIRHLKLTTQIRCKEEAPKDNPAAIMNGVIVHGGAACLYQLSRNAPATLNFLEKLRTFDPSKPLARRFPRGHEFYKNNCYGEPRPQNKPYNNFLEIAVDSFAIKGQHLDGISSSQIGKASNFSKLLKSDFGRDCLEKIETQQSARGSGGTEQGRRTNRGNVEPN